MNLYEFALLFRDTLHCPDALFLDGTVASLYSTALKRSDFRADLGPILAIAECCSSSHFRSEDGEFGWFSSAARDFGE